MSSNSSSSITYTTPSNANGSSAVGYAPATGTTALPDNTKLSTSDFLQIMVTSLKQQDPQQPQDPTSYYQQVMQMSTYQATLNEEANTSKLVNQQGLNLIGQTVSYSDPNNNYAQASGVVSAVNFSSTGTTATINGSTFDVGYINAVMTPGATGGTGTSSSATTPSQ
jgi:flagellar basal-body rod modification protein FlgD